MCALVETLLEINKLLIIIRALHLSAHLDNFRYNLPYERLFGGAVAVEENIFEDVNGFSNQFYGNFNLFYYI